MTNFIDDAIGKMLAREKANPKLPILQRKKKAMMYRQKVVGNVVPNIQTNNPRQDSFFTEGTNFALGFPPEVKKYKR